MQNGDENPSQVVGGLDEAIYIKTETYTQNNTGPGEAAEVQLSHYWYFCLHNYYKKALKIIALQRLYLKMIITQVGKDERVFITVFPFCNSKMQEQPREN